MTAEERLRLERAAATYQRPLARRVQATLRVLERAHEGLSIAQLVQRTGAARRETVRNHLRYLHELGLVKRRRRRHLCGGYEYILHQRDWPRSLMTVAEYVKDVEPVRPKLTQKGRASARYDDESNNPYKWSTGRPPPPPPGAAP